MKTRPTEIDVKNALLEILADEGKYETSLNHAVSYCEAGLKLLGVELQTQCLYVLNNIAGWRHPKAKIVREILKGYCNLK